MPSVDDKVDLRGPVPSLLRVVRDWLVVIAVAVGAALLVRSFVVQQFYISGPSMEPTLYSNNRVLVNKLSYRIREIRRGEVVVFDRVRTENGVEQHDDLIKRVIGLGDEEIEIRGCVVYIDGVRLAEPYLGVDEATEPDPVRRCRVADRAKERIPADEVFVMGDNRAESFDSRNFGPIPEDLVVGRAFLLIWPFAAVGLHATVRNAD